MFLKKQTCPTSRGPNQIRAWYVHDRIPKQLLYGELPVCKCSFVKPRNRFKDGLKITQPDFPISTQSTGEIDADYST